MEQEVIDYFKGDTMAADTWDDKYQMKDKDKTPLERTPDDMHRRMAKEFARIEYDYITKEMTNDASKLNNLSNFGQVLYWKRNQQRIKGVEVIEEEFYKYFKDFGQIVPQGSVMSNLGNPHIFGSLSNCFVVPDPYDSYGGIFYTDQQLGQVMKRRGGCGTTLNSLRYTNAFVSNASKSSTGVPIFAERYSNTTREVAQEGRRGALMLLLLCLHPDIFRFVSMKDDKTKVTGANVTSMLTDNFMEAVEADAPFLCRFPVDLDMDKYVTTDDFMIWWQNTEYNVVTEYEKGVTFMKIRAKELFDLIVEMAHKNGEPGVAFIDRIQDYSPDGVYVRFRPDRCNPCGEIWMSIYDACRLIAANFLCFVKNPFTERATIDVDKVYEVCYMQQRLGDNLVDLEMEAIDRILLKIQNDPEPNYVKEPEHHLWTAIKEKARAGRRTGNGLTALGDMLAALGLKYDSEAGVAMTERVMKIKMMAELDCTIDMAILRGTFDGWDRDLEFEAHIDEDGKLQLKGKNSFFQMMVDEFPDIAKRHWYFGRRNVSWSTCAPTGTVSMMTRTTSGTEPLFKAWYIRKRKVHKGMEGMRVDSIDQNGDKWMHYAVLHPQFKEWILKQVEWEIDKSVVGEPESIPEDALIKYFEASPWYSCQAEDISWGKRVDMQAVIQKYTTNAISSTVNLHKDVEKDIVGNIYMRAWKKGLKGITVYRDGSRTGVLVSETKAPVDEFGYTDAPKRPKELVAHYHPVKVRGKDFAVIVGIHNNLPYEIFAHDEPLLFKEATGKLVKIEQGRYDFRSTHFNVENIQLAADKTDEKLLTRMCSQLLRHGVNPKYIIDQVEKSEVTVVSFAKAIVRVLKAYVPDELIEGEACEHCNQVGTMAYQEGCKRCIACGHSKC